jgi:hypothetical protein
VCARACDVCARVKERERERERERKRERECFVMYQLRKTHRNNSKRDTETTQRHTDLSLSRHHTVSHHHVQCHIIIHSANHSETHTDHSQTHQHQRLRYTPQRHHTHGIFVFFFSQFQHSVPAGRQPAEKF